MGLDNWDRPAYMIAMFVMIMITVGDDGDYETMMTINEDDDDEDNYDDAYG